MLNLWKNVLWWLAVFGCALLFLIGLEGFSAIKNKKPNTEQTVEPLIPRDVLTKYGPKYNAEIIEIDNKKYIVIQSGNGLAIIEHKVEQKINNNDHEQKYKNSNH